MADTTPMAGTAPVIDLAVTTDEAVARAWSETPWLARRPMSTTRDN
jgi:hypothetical protein